MHKRTRSHARATECRLSVLPADITFMKCTLFYTGRGLVWIGLNYVLGQAETNTAEGRPEARKRGAVTERMQTVLGLGHFSYGVLWPQGKVIGLGRATKAGYRIGETLNWNPPFRH